VQHHRGIVQQVHLLVRYPPLFKPVRFPRIDRYPELRELEVRQLARMLLSSDPDHTLGLLKEKIESYGHGEFPHAEDILPALYELMESDESVKETPLPAPAPPNQQATGRDWEGLKKALTSSLTSGTFLDSQFYAIESRSSTGSPKIRPVYFCSTVGGSLTSKLAACKSLTWIMWTGCSSTIPDSSKIRARRAPSPRCADGYDSDIDDEIPDPEGSPECYPCSKLFVNPFPIHHHKLTLLPSAFKKILPLQTYRSSLHFC